MSRFIVALSIVSLTGCGAAITPTAPSVTVPVAIVAAQLVVTAATRPDQQMDVSAELLTKGGLPVAGKTVTFAITKGTITASAITGDDGWARGIIANFTGAATITATSDACATCTDTVAAIGTAPSASATAPLSVALSAGSVTLGDPTVLAINVPSATVTSIRWDFGDGGTLTTTSGNVQHTYRQAGSYLAAVTVSDSLGRTATGQTIARVDSASAAPAPAPTTAPLTLYLSVSNVALGSETRFGASWTGSPTSMQWDFGDGATLSMLASSVSHTYASAGARTVSVTIRDVEGRSASSAVTAHVYEAAPPPGTGGNTIPTPTPDPYTVALSTSFSPTAGSATTFIATPSTGTATSAQWTFGDGSTATTTSSGSTHTYASAGDYTASVTVRDASSHSASSSITVHVVAAPTTPSAALSVVVTCTAGHVGAATSCNATAYFGTDVVTSDVTSVKWQWADGSTTTTTTPATTHTFTVAGTYTIVATATRTNGTTATTQIAVSITP